MWVITDFIRIDLEHQSHALSLWSLQVTVVTRYPRISADRAGIYPNGQLIRGSDCGQSRVASVARLTSLSIHGPGSNMLNVLAEISCRFLRAHQSTAIIMSYY
jgi:hypothetical protein